MPTAAPMHKSSTWLPTRAKTMMPTIAVEAAQVVEDRMHDAWGGFYEPAQAGLVQERAVAYFGETAGWSSFFFMFPDIIFRWRGSVLKNIYVEIIISFILGVIAFLLTDDGLCDPSVRDCTPFHLAANGSKHNGHAIIGVLLAFLCVFRSQIAWNMYLEGRNHVGAIVAKSRSLAIEILASLCHATVEEPLESSLHTLIARERKAAAVPHDAAGGTRSLSPLPTLTEGSECSEAGAAERRSKPVRHAAGKWQRLGADEREALLTQGAELSILALESVRLLKLFFFAVVEHVRSTDGQVAWQVAHDMVQLHATRSEWAELRTRYGDVQAKGRSAVAFVDHPGKVDLEAGGGDEAANRVAKPPMDPGLKRTATGGLSSLPSNPRPSTLQRGDTGGATYLQRALRTRGRNTRTHDPTRSKPLVVLLWLRLNIERMHKSRAIEVTQLNLFSANIDALISAYNGIDKIDKMVLPLPYCQLLKIFQLFFVFSLPFVLGPQIGMWTPVVAVFTAIGFFGLDQVGVELEGPFGVDDNDFPLLWMGRSLSNDLDALVQTVSRQRMEARVQSLTKAEGEQVLSAAERTLGWADDVTDVEGSTATRTSASPPAPSPTPFAPAPATTATLPPAPPTPTPPNYGGWGGGSAVESSEAPPAVERSASSAKFGGVVSGAFV